jgi:3-oxoadipate enol-lactonase
MPLTTLDDFDCFYELDGREDGPVLALSHSLGQDHGMWAPQLADLTAHFRVLRYDIRGHGQSTTTAGDYTIGQLSRDAIALLNTLGIRRVAFCGLSLGGMIGQWIAINAPGRIEKLVLANTSPRVADPSMMERRRQAVLAGGMAAIADSVMSRFFSLRMLAENPPTIASARRTLLATRPAGYAGCCAAIRDMDQTADLPRIHVPTLVIGGDFDVPMPWPDHGGRLVRSIPGARAVRLPAAHLSNLETPQLFTTALLEFLLPDSVAALRAE